MSPLFFCLTLPAIFLSPENITFVLVRSTSLSCKISPNLPGFQVLLRVSGGAGGRGEEDPVHGLLQLRADRGDPKVAGHKRANPDRMEAVEDGAWAGGGSRKVQVGGGQNYSTEMQQQHGKVCTVH